MQHLTFGLIQSSEVKILQQMIQDTSFSCMSFNQQSAPIFVARSQTGIAGFTTGHKGWGKESHILMIHGTYLSNHYDQEDHKHELELAFVDWAEKNLGVTHYKSNESDEPKPISVLHLMPAKTIENQDVAVNQADDFSLPLQQLNYA